MTMSDALAFIDELYDSAWYRKPRSFGAKRMKETTLANMSYRRWALNELKMFLESCPNHEPIFLIEKYREVMDNKSCEGKTEEFRQAFGYCYDIATEVLDMLLVR